MSSSGAPSFLLATLLVLAAFSSSSSTVEAMSEQFTSTQLRVLQDFADYLLATVGVEEMQEAAAVLAMQGAGQGANMKTKRNYELIDSYLRMYYNFYKI